MKRSYLAWAALVVPTWIVLALCVHWQPVYFDGWTYVLWDRQYTGFTEWVTDCYLWGNPRAGQVLAYVVFAPAWWAAIVVPVIELALGGLLAALVLGRWPSPRSTDDALLAATIFAITAATVPDVGPMLFYAPYTANYVFGLVLCCALLVPYRFDLEAPRAGRWWWIPLVFVVGAAAGMSNEHTGPTIAVIAIAACVRRRRPPPWMIAGALGVIAGGLALYFAPGQDIRYQGLATQHSTLGWIASRGVLANTRIVALVAAYLVPALAWVIGATIARATSRREREPMPRAYAIALVVGGVVAIGFALTLLASPKQGQRLYFASLAVASAAIAGWVVPQLRARWSRVTAVVLATGVLGFTFYRCVHDYAILGRESRARVAALTAALPGSTVLVPRYSIGSSRWALRDDFELESRRRAVADWLGLAAIQLKPR